MLEIIECRSSSSLPRYRSDITSYRSGLDVVNRLQPIAFSWNADDATDFFGLGAETVAQIEPLPVINNDRGEFEGFKYDHAAVVLINAVKERQAGIQPLTRVRRSRHS